MFRYLLMLVFVVAPRGVLAKPTNTNKDLQAGFVKFIESITDDPKTALLRGTQLVLLPDASGVVTAPTGLSTTDLVGAQAGPVKWKVRFVRASIGTTFHTVGSVAADVDALGANNKKLGTLRVSAQLRRDDPKDPWTVLAVDFSVPLSDDLAGARAALGKERKLAAVPAGPAPAAKLTDAGEERLYLVEKATQLSKEVLSNQLSNGGILLGTGPGENVTYDSLHPDKIRTWKLELSTDGNVAYGGEPDDTGALWLALNVKVKRTFKGKPIEHAYRALLLYEIIVSGEGGNVSSRLTVAHFSSPR